MFTLHHCAAERYFACTSPRAVICLAGAGTLYLYALGMGIPLIIVTLFGNRCCHAVAPGCNNVKEGFGFVILALPVFLLERVVGDVWGLRLWSLLGIAFFGWALCA